MTAKNKKIMWGALIVIALIFIYRYIKKKKVVGAQLGAVATISTNNGDQVAATEQARLVQDNADHDTDRTLNTTVVNALTAVNSWTGDSCRDSNGNWGTVQPDGSCLVQTKASFAAM